MATTVPPASANSLIRGTVTPLELTGGSRCCWSAALTAEGREDGDLNASIHPVSEGYFEALGVDILASRPWRKDEARAEPAPVAISVSLSRELYGSEGR